MVQEIKAVFLAEVINYKKIAERQMPAFVREFKGAVARLLAGLSHPPVIAESWGKSLSFVFDDLQAAALFALDLRDLVAHTSWAECGLPKDLGIRIVLHAGPLFAFNDPVLQRTSCIGTHVTRGARIEPVTPPGQVYVSQEFAALCGAQRVELVGFEFLGLVPTAKLFDDAPLYRLDRRTRGKR
jgi:class 3 adenylate cyclase